MLFFSEIKNEPHLQKRIALFIIGIGVLVLVFLFQKFSYYHFFAGIVGYSGHVHEYTVFIINKTTRLLINDTTCLVLIYALFYNTKYIRLGAFVQLIEMFLILPAYFIVKLNLEGDSEISSPLLSQFHRLIVNPTLMILLIIGFFYQNKNSPVS